MCEELRHESRVRKVSIQLQSSMSDSSVKTYSGSLAKRSEGFCLSWNQPADEAEGSEQRYRLSYIPSQEQLCLERTGDSKLDLCFHTGCRTEGYLTIPQGQILIEIQTLRMTIPDFREDVDSFGNNTEHELLLQYQLLFQGADPTENLLSLKISLETEEKAI